MKNLYNCLCLDFRLMKPYLKSIFLTVGAAAVISIVIKSGDLLFSMSAVFLIMVASYPFAISEKNKLDTLYGTLPVTRKDIVIGRYLFAAVLAAVGTVVPFVFSVLINAIFKQGFEFKVMIFVWAAVMSAFLIIISLQFPIFFKFGFSKGKMASYIPMLIILAAVAALPMLSNSWDLDISAFIDRLANNTVLTCIGLLVLGAACAVVSCCVSCRTHVKKDF